jgi:hypothetical protein
MNIHEANIEIVRHGSQLASISVIMPKWLKAEDNGLMAVNIPFFGLKTVAKNEEDAETAIEEAIKCFCISAEKFGRGIESELTALGWTVEAGEHERTLLTYSIESSNYIVEQVMQTGEQYAHKELEICA